MALTFIPCSPCLLLLSPTLGTYMHSSLSCHKLTLQVTPSPSPFQLLLSCLHVTFIWTSVSPLLPSLGNLFSLMTSNMIYVPLMAKFSLLSSIPTQPIAYWMSWSVSEITDSPYLNLHQTSSSGVLNSDNSTSISQLLQWATWETALTLLSFKILFLNLSISLPLPQPKSKLSQCPSSESTELYNPFST